MVPMQIAKLEIRNSKTRRMLLASQRKDWTRISNGTAWSSHKPPVTALSCFLISSTTRNFRIEWVAGAGCVCYGFYAQKKITLFR